MSTSNNTQKMKKNYQRQTPPKNSTGSCQPQKEMFVRDNPGPNHPTYPGGSGFGPIPPSSVSVDQSTIRLRNLENRVNELEKQDRNGQLENRKELAECYTTLAHEYRLMHTDKYSDDAQSLFQKAILIFETTGVTDTPKAIKCLLECYDQRGRILFELHEYADAPQSQHQQLSPGLCQY